MISDSPPRPRPRDAARRAIAPTSWGYLRAATLVRMTDGGAAVALVSVAVASHGRVGASAGGVVAAMLTAPQALGPLVARPLARARDPRRVLSAAFVLLGLTLALSGLALAHDELWIAGGAACLAGCTGPFVTGGLSTLAAAGESADPVRRRRADALDAATYGIGTTLGPAVTGVLVTVVPAWVAVMALSCCAVLAGASVLVVPCAGGGTGSRDDAAVSVGRALSQMWSIGALRRTLMATCIGALGSGGLLVIVVVLGKQLTGHPATGALLAAAFGAGSLTGSLVVAARPIGIEPEKATMALLLSAGVLLALCALSPTTVVAAVGLSVTGALAAAQFAASLSVRSAYAPLEIRAQVYVTMAGVKMGCAAAGTALASALISIGPRPALLIIAGVMSTGPTAAILDRARATRGRMRRGPTYFVP